MPTPTSTPGARWRSPRSWRFVAFVWTPKDGPRLLGTAGVDQSTARDVNKHGQVVGGFNSRAFVWTRAGGLVDLNTRLKDAPDGFELDEAYAISDNGSIVAGIATGGLVLLVPGACTKAPPVIGNIKRSGAARPGALLTFTAGFRDSDLRDAHTASWSWGDGDAGAGNVASVQGRGAVSGQHAYRAPGVYKVRLTVSDSGGERSVAQSTVVVGASGVVLAGDGRFLSARGASRHAPHDAGHRPLLLPLLWRRRPGRWQGRDTLQRAGHRVRQRRLRRTGRRSRARAL